DQYEWIEKTLAANAGVKWTLVFMHQPLWNQQAETLRWPDVEKLLAPRKHTVYVGHHHSYVKYERNNGKYFILATTGGSSRLRGPRFGEFDHVVWITMTDNGPIMANLELSGIWNESVVTEQSSNYFRPLFNGQPVRISPMFTDGSTFSNGTTEIRLTNDSDAPMNVSFELAANKNLTSSIIRQSLTIAPNSVEIIPLKLSGKAAPIATLEPVALRGTVTFHGEGMADVTMDVTQNARPAKKEYISKGTTKTIDGKLDDWAALPYSETEMYTEANPFSHKGGKADGSVRFGISYDDQFLYIGAEVTDDELLAVASSRPYNQDAFQVIIDGRSENTSSFGTSLSGVLYIGMSPYVDGADNTTPFTSGNKPDGTIGVTRKTEKGYATELAIPLSYLGEQQGGDWKTVRVNVGVNDFDNDYSHRTNLWWQPDWRGAANYPGSGTFFRK
ncbi:MAG: sugar-binding protein, partial [Imperialibacter sp.]